MTQVLHPSSTSRPAAGRHLSPTLWRVAGALVITHIVMMFAGFSQERSTMLGASVADARHAFAEGSIARIMVGGYVESLSFVVLLPALVFLARAVGTRTEAARWAGQTSFAAGLTYVAITLAAGMPAGAAALYGGHHGADLHTALMVTDIRNFAFYLSLMVLAAQAIGLGVAAWLDGFSRLWVGVGGIVTGLALLVGVAGAGQEWQDYAAMVWMIWFVGVGVCLVRFAPRQRVDAPR